ncbi:hypothetical protein J6590_051267 [Homalodisca vitripennis]|nr:hypothetical protein J6590_051267 [Homalodisca vitripennis]
MFAEYDLIEALDHAEDQKHDRPVSFHNTALSSKRAPKYSVNGDSVSQLAASWLEYHREVHGHRQMARCLVHKSQRHAAHNSKKIPRRVADPSHEPRLGSTEAHSCCSVHYRPTIVVLALCAINLECGGLGPYLPRS